MKKKEKKNKEKQFQYSIKNRYVFWKENYKTRKNKKNMVCRKAIAEFYFWRDISCIPQFTGFNQGLSWKEVKK